MPKQKYYYAVIQISTRRVKEIKTWDTPAIFTDKEMAENWKGLFRAKTKIVPIPADSLHKLILSHTMKAK